jgi:glycosyltransferase involved in cell wall biosynthesis
MIKLSSVIITYNEEQDIRRCLESVKRVADEIIVVDSFSQDNTVAIATEMGAKVFTKKFNGFGEQKAFCVAQATHDWILSTDVDEILSDELVESILAIKQNPTHNAYYVNIMTNYCGHWIKHCGWYPEYKLRLLHKGKGTMNLNKVHEGFEMNDKSEKIGYLKGNLLHYSYNTLAEHTQKIHFYTDLAVQKAQIKGRKVNKLQILLAPKWAFFYHYIIRHGFMDGYWGYILCRNLQYESFLKYVKIHNSNRK